MIHESLSRPIFGVSMGLKRRLLECLKMIEGNLLVLRYLGFPLNSKRLAASNYTSLLEEIYSYLPYCIASKYWTSTFILPKKVTWVIEQIFNRFLWNGNEAKFSKSKGGLIRMFFVFLKMRLVWDCLNWLVEIRQPSFATFGLCLIDLLDRVNLFGVLGYIPIWS
jgi:hypothetical protein